MANERFRFTQIWQKHIKGLRQYPFSMVDFVSTVPGSVEVILGQGIVPDGTSIFVQRGIPLGDGCDTPEVSFSDHIDPLFIYDGSLGTGLREAV